MKFNKKSKCLLAISLLLIPKLVFADADDSGLSIGVALFMEAFVSLHMSGFVLIPLSKLFAPDNYKRLFWALFLIRAAILLYCDLCVSTLVAVFDFISVFIGAFIIVPISYAIFGKKNKIETMNSILESTQEQGNIQNLKCLKCGNVLLTTGRFCTNCGEPVSVNGNVNASVALTKKPSDFDSIFDLPESDITAEFIRRQMVKLGFEVTDKLIPNEVLKRKKILNAIFSLLLCFYISLIFFHFPFFTYAVGIIILFIFFKLTRKYDFMKYLVKQVKARPGEKISNIIMIEKGNLTEDNSKVSFCVSLIVAIVLPLVIFWTPKVFYEKMDGGYGVRFYAFGLTNFKTAEIPEYYKNEKVISLRGNTFSNMVFLKSVKLPDSIKEIRGQAFKNCASLNSVNIPKELEYLGGGAFYNATHIERIELPDSLTYLGGESFYGASSLEYIKLSENLSEIRGDTFEYCDSLKSITIPDKVTRIGAHAFYGDTNLSEVIIGENSMLNEIGSSAFRRCDNLYNIKVPSDTYINERAFKESPTNISYFYRNN